MCNSTGVIKGQIAIAHILKNVRVIPATAHMFFMANTCRGTIATAVSCVMQHSAATKSEESFLKLQQSRENQVECHKDEDYNVDQCHM